LSRREGNKREDKGREIRQEVCLNNNNIKISLYTIKKQKCCRIVVDIAERVSNELRQEVCGILRSDGGYEIFTFLMKHNASTTLELKKKLGHPKRTVRHYLNKLKTIGAITTPTKIDDKFIKHNNYGPKPYVWALEDASEDQVLAAWTRYREYFRKSGKTPKPMQTPLDPEYKEMLPRIAEKYIKNAIFPDKPSNRECKNILLKNGVPINHAEHLVSPLIKEIKKRV